MSGGAQHNQPTSADSASETRATATVECHATDLPQASKGLPEVRNRLQGASLDDGLILKVEETNAKLVHEHPRAESWPVARAIELVTDQRMAQMLHVHPNLVRPQGNHSAMHKRVPLWLFTSLPIGSLVLCENLPYRRRWRPQVRVYANPFRVGVDAGVNRCVAFAPIHREGAMDKRDVILQDTRGDLFAHMLLALKRFAYKKRARSVDVEAMTTHKTPVVELVARGIAVRVRTKLQK
jgi:hypothetical protein